jgi:hypothetical protein
MALVWTGEHDMYVLTNMHNPAATEGNFCDKNGNALKPQILQGHNQHMGYAEKGYRMTQHLLNPMVDMKVETKPLFPPVNHDYYKHILSPDIIWC